MGLIGHASLPKAHNGCRCSCHRTPGIIHMVACCGPSKGPLASKEWFEKHVADEHGVDVTNAPSLVVNTAVDKLTKESTDIMGGVNENGR